MVLVLLDFDGELQEELYITLEIRADCDPHRTATRAKGKLPSPQAVIAADQAWRTLYDQLWGIYRLEAVTPREPFPGSPGELWRSLLAAGEQLTQALNEWLRADAFRPIREKLLEKLQPDTEIRCIVQVEHPDLRRLPWQQWELLARYPQAEIALSSPSYEAVANPVMRRETVRILAILGHAAGIDVERDRALLAALPQAHTHFLVEPTRQELYAALWDAAGWDILCFAGHSQTQGQERGYLALNAETTIELSDIAHALKKAVKQGLKIAIFNSCDGLGLAHQMEPFAIPNIIVMREPVPDRVAQAFLKGLLQSLGQEGQALPLAVREAREQLQALEDDCPFASWLPVLFQNPTERSLVWRDLYEAPEPLPPCPYRGLASFSPADAAIFCGRDAMVEKLTYAVHTKPFVALLGPSGSGKSSLVLAGLVPQLTPEALPILLRPGAQPLRQLAQALCPYLTNTPWTPAALQTALEAGTVDWLSLIDALLAPQAQRRLLLVVDQFEELYTLCSDRAAQTQFLQHLLCLIPNPGDRVQRLNPRITIVITLRADFLEVVLADPLLAPVLGTYPPELLPPMTRADLEVAIAQPAALMGVTLAPGLTERILDAVCDRPGNLPLLEFALTLLWEQQHERQLTHEAYDAIGGVETALVTYAEQVYHALSPQAQDQARHIFVQLVHPGSGTADTRRLADRASFAPARTPLLSHLADQRLLVVGEQTVELVHEVLISAWTRLQTWLNEDRRFRVWQERLRQELTQWQTHARPSDRLLQGAALSEAEQWQQTHYAALSDAERDYIVASMARSRQERQRRQRLQACLVTGICTSSLLAVVSLWQWQRAVVGQMSTQLTMLSDASEQLFASKKELDGLLESIRAVRQMGTAGISPETRIRAIASLHQAVYGIREVNRLEAHARTVIDLAYSPDGQLLVSVGDDQTVRLWQRDGTLLATLINHTDLVRSVSWHPDGQRFLTGSYDQTVRLWHWDGELRAVWRGHGDKVNRVAWSPDGTQVVSVDAAGEIRLWTAQGDAIATWNSGQGWLTDVVWSPDGERLATASRGAVVLWSTAGDRVGQITDAPKNVNSVQFSPNGEQLITAGEDGTVRFWSPQGELRDQWDAHRERIWQVSFSPDGGAIATASADKTVKLWTVDGELLRTFAGHNASTYRLAFHPTGPLIASASADTTIRIWHQQGLPVRTFPHAHPVTAVRFHPGDSSLATATETGEIRLWQRNKESLRRLHDHAQGVRELVFLRGGQELISVGGNQQWQKQTLQGEVKRQERGDAGLAVSPDSRWLVVGQNTDSTVWVWRDGVRSQRLAGHTEPITTAQFSPDGRLLATAGDDETIRIWQRQGDRFHPTPQVLYGHGSRIDQLAWSPDGQTLASGSDDGTIRLWRRRHQSVKSRADKVLRGHLSKVRTVVFSPDGQILASGSADGMVKLWTIEGTLLTSFVGHQGEVWQLDFSPEGQWLASASADQTVILWNLNLNVLLDQGCFWLRDYLATNPSVNPADRALCATKARS